MKIDIQRCIKVLSSFVVIFMVLLTAVAMPVFAVNDGLYNLSDMVSYRTVDDNVIKVHYMPAKLGITPCIVTYLNGTEHDTEYADSVKFIFTSGSPVWAFYVSPLGVPAVNA